MTLTELIQHQLDGNTVNYTCTEAIYISVPFSPESEVRFGQRQFRYGEIEDGKELLCHNEKFTDEIEEYIDGWNPVDISSEELAEHFVFCSEGGLL
jgi:hypothetical protein